MKVLFIWRTSSSELDKYSSVCRGPTRSHCLVVCSLDVCRRFEDLVMCPTCDTGCEYWHLKENCKHSMLTYLFDNGATVCFSVFVALWSATFLELWKR